MFETFSFDTTDTKKNKLCNKNKTETTHCISDDIA